MAIFVSFWPARLNVLAQAHPVFVRLKGVAIKDNGHGNSADLQVAGNFAYLARGGLQIFDVSSPSTPVWVGGYEQEEAVNAIQVVGPYAYLAEGATRTFTNDPGAFEIVDVSDASSPVRIGGVETLGRAQDVCVAGNYAYVAESPRWNGANLLGALEIFDVSVPTNPIRVATFATAGSGASVEVAGSYVYLADGVTDLQVLDVSDPANPKLVGAYKSDTSVNHCGFEPGGPGTLVQVVGNLAYSAGNNGLKILDISDPASPALMGENFCFPIESFRVSGRYVYATIWSSFANSFILAIFDASDPANLVSVGSKENWYSSVFHVSGNWIYVATDPLSVYQTSGRPAAKPGTLGWGRIEHEL